MTETEFEIPDSVEEDIAEQMGDDDDQAADDDEDALHSPEGELVAPAPSAFSEKDIEKGFKTVEGRFKTYSAAVTQAFPEGFHNLAGCPLCIGYIPGFVNIEQAGALPDEVTAIVKQFIGIAREVEYPEAPNIETCRVCQGYGKTKTGSRVPGNETTTCTNCKGFGYYPPPATGDGGAPVADTGHHPVDVPAAAVVQADVDNWGEPKILPDGRANPNYGKQPAFKIQVAPYGTTAGLTAQDGMVI